MASNYEKYKDVIQKTNRARRNAIARLITAHRDEYNALYHTEALSLGLRPTKIEGMQRKAAELALEGV